MQLALLRAEPSFQVPWFRTLDPLALLSSVLGLKVCVTMPHMEFQCQSMSTNFFIKVYWDIIIICITLNSIMGR